MRSLLVLLFAFISCAEALAQNKGYQKLVAKAEAAYINKQYDSAARYYATAFRLEGAKSKIDDRYNAACCWARVDKVDSAFSNLFHITRVHKWASYPHLIVDIDLRSLHSSGRWNVLCREVKANMLNNTPGADTALIAELIEVFKDDQMYRMQIGELESKYAFESPQMQALWDTIGRYDSINLQKVTALLDKNGWMPPAKIGDQGVKTIFLVLQHADSATQTKYMPMLRAAAQNGALKKSSFALFEDRLALRQGKKQIYGSQIACTDSGCYVDWLEDPIHVDERRKAVGLGLMADYVRQWKIVWDAAAFAKKQEQDDLLNRQR